MFMQVCTCDFCKNSTSLKVKLTVEYESHLCEECNEFKTSKWDFLFCNMDCLAKWQSANQGRIPCMYCHGTGWFAGFKENGICTLCEGKSFLLI